MRQHHVQAGSIINKDSTIYQVIHHLNNNSNNSSSSVTSSTDNNSSRKGYFSIWNAFVKVLQSN